MYKVVDYDEFWHAIQEDRTDDAIRLVTCAPQIPEHIINELKEEEIL